MSDRAPAINRSFWSRIDLESLTALSVQPRSQGTRNRIECWKRREHRPDTNLSAAGDGISNWWKAQYWLDLFDPNLGSKDADGDGQSNLQEWLAGTDPINSASSFLVISVTQTGSSVRVT
jgi:hypothetical protein